MPNQEIELKQKISSLLKSEKFSYQSFIDLSSELFKLDTENLRFTVDANALINLGRDSIKDETTAIIELVKNGYDADALKIEIDIITLPEKKYIRVADNGIGMTQKQVLENWLRIGYSEKKVNKITAKERRKTGEKGIGRLSADRLGSNLNLITKSKESNLFGLAIDWEEFNTPQKNLHSIPLRIIQDPTINIPISLNHINDTGTELIIENPRHIWTDVDVQNLYNELSIFSQPNKPINDFEISINTDIETNFKGKVIPPFNKSAEVEITVVYDGDESIKYTIKDKHGFSDEVEKTAAWKDIIKYVNDVKKMPVKDSLTCGPVIFELLFFLDETSVVTGKQFKLKDLKAFLKNNNGVKIFRDDVSVKPYGYAGLQGGDWLDLGERQGRDPAGIDRESWKVKPYQLLGTILISRDTNTKLIDSAAREGLVHNDGFFDLRALTLAAVRLLEVHRHNIYKNAEREKPARRPANKILETYKEEIVKLRAELEQLKNDGEQNQVLKNATAQITLVLDKTAETEKTIEEILNKSRTLAGLATIGISSAVFGHETQISLSNLLMSTGSAKEYLLKTPPDVQMALKKIGESLTYADLVSEWGAFSLTRIRRDKRKKDNVELNEIINRIVDELTPNFNAVDITIQRDLVDISDKTFQMDIETILINLLTNAYSACLEINDIPRKIKVSLRAENKDGTEGYSIIVSDSGLGVLEDLREIIWEPLFTTKLSTEGKEIGTGLGLPIVKSIVEDLDGKYFVYNDEELGGALFEIWLPYNKKK